MFFTKLLRQFREYRCRARWRYEVYEALTKQTPGQWWVAVDPAAQDYLRLRMANYDDITGKKTSEGPPGIVADRDGAKVLAAVAKTFGGDYAFGTDKYPPRITVRSGPIAQVIAHAKSVGLEHRWDGEKLIPLDGSCEAGLCQDCANWNHAEVVDGWAECSVLKCLVLGEKDPDDPDDRPCSAWVARSSKEHSDD